MATDKMSTKIFPDKDAAFPNPRIPSLCYIKNVVKNPRIIVGDGAIIGANATVASHIPPYCIAVGNPAKVIRKRFDEEIIELLEQLRWWDRPIDEIDSLMPILTTSDQEAMKASIKTYLGIK